jgi:hypothetical protein
MTSELRLFTMRKAFYLHPISFLPAAIAAGLILGLPSVQAQPDRTASRLTPGETSNIAKTPAGNGGTGANVPTGSGGAGATAPGAWGGGGATPPAGGGSKAPGSAAPDSPAPGSGGPGSPPPNGNPNAQNPGAPGDSTPSPDQGDAGAAGAAEPGDQGDPLAPKVDETVDRPAILANYAAIDDAFASQDVDKMLDQTHGQDFEAIDRDGKSMDFNGVHDALLDLFDKAKSAKVVTRVRLVTFKNNTATAEVRRHLDLSLVDSKTTENSLVTIDNYSRDFWIKEGDRWLERRSRLLTSARHVTGKPPALLVTTW